MSDDMVESSSLAKQIPSFPDIMGFHSCTTDQISAIFQETEISQKESTLIVRRYTTTSSRHWWWMVLNMDVYKGRDLLGMAR